MKPEIISIIKKTFEEYKDDFVYIDLNNIQFDKNSIKGHFKFTGSAYLKTYNKILNNTEGMFIFNQLQYILLASMMLEERILDPADPEDTYTKLDGIVYKDMGFNFKRSIIDSDELTFICTAEPFFDHKNRHCYNVQIDLVNGAFDIQGTAVCLNRNVHAAGY